MGRGEGERRGDERATEGMSWERRKRGGERRGDERATEGMSWERRKRGGERRGDERATEGMSWERRKRGRRKENFTYSLTFWRSPPFPTYNVRQFLKTET